MYANCIFANINLHITFLTLCTKMPKVKDQQMPAQEHQTACTWTQKIIKSEWMRLKRALHKDIRRNHCEDKHSEYKHSAAR